MYTTTRKRCQSGASSGLVTMSSPRLAGGSGGLAVEEGCFFFRAAGSKLGQASGAGAGSVAGPGVDAAAGAGARRACCLHAGHMMSSGPSSAQHQGQLSVKLPPAGGPSEPSGPPRRRSVALSGVTIRTTPRITVRHRRHAHQAHEDDTDNPGLGALIVHRKPETVGKNAYGHTRRNDQQAHNTATLRAIRGNEQTHPTHRGTTSTPRCPPAGRPHPRLSRARPRPETG